MRSHELGLNKDSRLRFLRLAPVLALAAILSAAAPYGARAQPAFPAKPIRIFIPYGAGGVADLTMRLLAQKLTERTNQQDVVAAARKSPGKLNFGAINPGSTQNLSAHLLKQVSGADVAIVPFKTTPDLVTAVLRGDIDIGFDFYAALRAVISDNQVRII